MKNIWLWTSAAIILVGGYFVFFNKPSGITGEPIKIGVVASLTGAGSFYGENVRNGVLMAAEEINAVGGINGRSLEIIFEDDQTNPQQTVTAVKKFLTVDGVIAIIGPQWDFQVNAALPLAIEHKIAFVSGSTAFDTLIGANRDNPYFFTTYPAVSGSYDAIAAFFARTKIKSAVILAVNNDWGVANTDTYVAAAKAAGVAIMDIVRLPKVDNNDFRTQTAQIKELSPDAVLMSINDADAINFVKWHKDFGLRGEVLNNQNFGYLLTTGRLDAKAAAGFYFSDFNNPNGDFKSKYKARYGGEPQIAADTSYDALYVIKDAIERGGATKSGILGALGEMQNFQGVSGVIDFRAAHYPADKKAVLRHITEKGVETL